MPRPRKPTAHLELSGAFRKDPQRRRGREGEAKPSGPLGAKPTGLSELEAACWDQLVALSPPGVLMNSDEAIVELTARLWAAVKRGNVKASLVAQYRGCLQQLGMTPASRSLVPVAPSKPKWSEFADI